MGVLRTGTIKLNGTTVNASVDRDLLIYPYGPQGRAAFKTAVEKRKLPIAITSGARAGQVLQPVVEVNPCSAISERCSGNISEFGLYNLAVAAAGGYNLTLTYKATEGEVTGLMRVNENGGTAVVFPHSADFTTKVVNNVQLVAGQNVIQLSSGNNGGFVCFKQVCANK